MRASVTILSGNQECVAAKPGSRSIHAVNCERLSALKSKNPVCFPPPEHSVDDLAAFCEEALFRTNGQFIRAAEVEDLGDVEVTQAVVALNAKSGKQGSTVGERGLIEHICGVGAALRPGEVRESLEAAAELPLVVELQRMIVTVPRKTCVDKASWKIRIGRKVKRIQTWRKYLIR